MPHPRQASKRLIPSRIATSGRQPIACAAQAGGPDDKNPGTLHGQGGTGLHVHLSTVTPLMTGARAQNKDKAWIDGVPVGT